MKPIAALILVLCFSFIHAQNNEIEKAQKLIESKKYQSAMKVLDIADPKNQNPDIVIVKTDLLLNYFAKSLMHKYFALKDLDPKEDLMQVREDQGDFKMFAFAPDSVLQILIKANPGNYKLRKALGNYYHDVHLKYPEDWFEPDSVVVEKFKDNYLLAYDKGVFDYWSLYGIGYAYLTKGDYTKSISFLEKSIALKNDPSAYYNLAYAYLYTDQHEKGIECAKKALDLYDYPDYKADAARMIAVMYGEIKQEDKAIEFYYKANSIKPGDYYTIKPILELETLNNKDNSKVRAKEFFSLAPENPTIYQDLIKIYREINKPDELITFLENQKADFADNNKVIGNIYFYIASIQHEKEEYTLSKTNFERAREIFKKVYPSDHKVFEAIKLYLAKMK